MAEKKGKYLIWLETLHRQYTDRTCITQMGRQAASLRLLAEMYEIRCRFGKILECIKKEAFQLDDEGLDYEEWSNPEKWKRGESLAMEEDMRETFDIKPESPLSQTYANELTSAYGDLANFDQDGFRNMVSSLFVFEQIVDPQRTEVTIDTILRELQATLVKIKNAKERKHSDEEYEELYDKELLRFGNDFIKQSRIESKHQTWKNNLIDDLSEEVLKERRIELLLCLFDTGFLDDLKETTHKGTKDDVLGLKDYDFKNWNDRMDEAVKYAAALRRICPIKDDLINFDNKARIGKYIFDNHIPTPILDDFFENMELIKKVQREILICKDPNAISLKGEKPAKCFVEMVKRIMLKAEDRNGERIETKPRGHLVEYVYNVDGKGFCKVMDDLLITNETDIENYLGRASAEEAISIKYVAPFIGIVIETHEYSETKMQKTDFEDTFKFIYGDKTSAVSKMSAKKDLPEEADRLFEIVKKSIKKHKSDRFPKLPS